MLQSTKMIMRGTIGDTPEKTIKHSIFTVIKIIALLLLAGVAASLATSIIIPPPKEVLMCAEAVIVGTLEKPGEMWQMDIDESLLGPFSEGDVVSIKRAKLSDDSFYDLDLLKQSVKNDRFVLIAFRDADPKAVRVWLGLASAWPHGMTTHGLPNDGAAKKSLEECIKYVKETLQNMDPEEARETRNLFYPTLQSPSADRATDASVDGDKNSIEETPQIVDAGKSNAAERDASPPTAGQEAADPEEKS